MKMADRRKRIPLVPGAKVAVIGGGPAGAFFAIHLLRRAEELGRDLRVIILERRWPAKTPPTDNPQAAWNGCNYCAGGISPRLNDVLKSLNSRHPEDVIQSRIRSINIQGYLKNIELQNWGHNIKFRFILCKLISELPWRHVSWRAARPATEYS